MSLYANITADSKVFAENAVINDGIRLKDPKPIREAFVLQELSRMPQSKLKEYVKSSHARALVENEIITPDALENLTKDAFGDRATEFMVCHMAREIGDDRWDALVRARAEERELLNSLIRDYGPVAAQTCKGYRDDCVNKYVPAEFRI